MKKIYIACAVLATAALTSCLQEQSFNDVKLGENDVVFTFQGAASTKSAEAPVQRGVSVFLGNAGGSSLYLEETISNLDAISPATKGTPAYTENVGTLYKNDLNVYATEFGGDATFENMDEEIYSNGGWRYRHSYDKDYWPAEGSVGFYLNMPATLPGVTMTSRTGGKFTFTYTSPETASAQKDILFAYRTLSKEEHNGYLPAGAPVLFHHALTGVKFRIQNDTDEREDLGIKISNITFKGLKNTGTCVVTPRKEKENNQETDYVDNRTGDYSSGDQTLTTGTVAWTNTDATSSTNVIYQYFAEADTVTFVSGDDNNFAPSYYEAGQSRNLNKSDASYTFWMIPQSFADNTNAILYIEYSVNGNNEYMEIDLHDVLANVTWKAGELRTYTIKIDDVNVKIEDSVTISADQKTTYTDDHGDVHTIYGGTKNGITITNTGNTDAFIRAAITGQWVDENYAPVFSFTDYKDTSAIIKEIDSWYNDQFGTGTGKFGVFDGLVGYTKNGKSGAGNAGWVKGNDGYYYYTTKVAPDATTGTAVFTSYTVTLANVPKIKVAGALQEVHFVMEISTQAISAKKVDGTDYAWNKAWENALGKDPSATN